MNLLKLGIYIISIILGGFNFESCISNIKEDHYYIAGFSFMALISCIKMMNNCLKIK